MQIDPSKPYKAFQPTFTARRRRAEFVLGDVQPIAVPGRAAQLQPMHQFVCPARLEHLVKRFFRVHVQADRGKLSLAVAHEHHRLA